MVITTQPAPDPNRRRLRALGGSTGVWLLAALLGSGAVALYVGVVRHLAPVGTPFHVPWAVLLFSFALAEVSAIHILQFRRGAHSVSLSEIPLVVSLFVLSPKGYVAAHVLGAFIGLAGRRQSLMKLFFNLAQFSVGACAAAAIFYSVVDDTDALAPSGIGAAFFAAFTASAIAIVAIAAAVSCLERSMQFESVPEMLGFGVLTAAGNTSVGIIAVTMLWRSPATTWVLLVPTAALVLAYRAYTNLRHQGESLEFLYESVHLLQNSPELGQAVQDLLNQARELFRADVAELTLLTGDVGEAVRTRIGPGERVDSMVPIGFDLRQEPWATLVTHRGVRAVPPDHQDALLTGLLGDVPLRDAMITVLHGEDRLIGTMVVANRSGAIPTFDSADARLFETLAHQVTVVWKTGRLEQSLDQLRQLEVQLSYQAQHDPLTALANRSLFTTRVRDALARSAAGTTAVAVMFIDLDDFKVINDRFGHSSGDQVLVAVAERIRSQVRPTDTPARVGGDEFAVLVEDPDLAFDARASAERILAAVSAPVGVQGVSITPRVSIGVAVPVSSEVGVEQLLRDADTAMYSAKGSGKNQVALFERTMRASEQERTLLLTELRASLLRGELVLHYQPIVDLPSGQVAGVESLLRWNHPRLGLVAPSAFLDLAEDSGLVLPMGNLTLRMACEQACKWQNSGLGSSITMGINLSPSQVHHPKLLAEVKAAIEESGCNPHGLVLEVGEGTLMHATEGGLENLLALKEAGCRLAIDDYGTGYSSLSYLAKLPIDIFKIAKPFIDGLQRGGEDVALAKAIIRLGQALGREVIAVGIESEEQRHTLQSLGCTLGQGFLYSGAVAAPELEPLLVGGFVGAVASYGPRD